MELAPAAQEMVEAMDELMMSNSEMCRGRFYERYAEKRDAKLREEWRLRMQLKEEEIRSLWSHLDRSRILRPAAADQQRPAATRRTHSISGLRDLTKETATPPTKPLGRSVSSKVCASAARRPATRAHTRSNSIAESSSSSGTDSTTESEFGRRKERKKWGSPERPVLFSEPANPVAAVKGFKKFLGFAKGSKGSDVGAMVCASA